MRRIKKGFVLTLLFLGVLGMVLTATAEQGEVVVTFGVATETMVLDAAKYMDENSCICVVNTYDSLVHSVEPGEPPVPWLAKSWSVSEDGLTYTFSLHEGVLFHDGTELTAEDVVFSMDRMIHIGQGYSWLFSTIMDPGDTEALDKYTVAFHLNEMSGPFIAFLIQFRVVNKDLVLANAQPGDYGEFGDYGQVFLETHDAGSGPYTIESIQFGEKVVFTKFDDYWRGWEEGQVDKGILLVIPERATLALMAKAGEIDITDRYMGAEIFEDLAETPGINVIEVVRLSDFIIHLNNQIPPFDDVNVRKAVAYATDYGVVLNNIQKGGKLAVGPVPTLMPGHNPKAHSYYYDMELAKQYLAQSKYSPEELQAMTLTFTYVTGHEVEERVGLLVAESLKELGLKVQLQPELWSRITELVKKPETTSEMVCAFAGAKYTSPDFHTYAMYHSDSWGRHQAMSWYYNPIVEYLIETARRTVDQEERYRLYGEAQRIIAEDCPTVFLPNPPARRAIRDYLTGYKFVGVSGFDIAFYTFRVTQ